MITFATEKGDGKEFVSHAPGCWEDVAPELWKDWKWQLKNRVTSLAQLEKHLDLSEEECSGVLLSGDKLALAITPHFFNLIPRNNPGDPIRRQVISDGSLRELLSILHPQPRGQRRRRTGTAH